MPSSRPRTSRLPGPMVAALGAALGVVLSLTVAAAPAHPAGVKKPVLSRQPITVNAASVDVDYKTQTVVYQKVVITQGTIVVSADRARTTVGHSRQSSEWTLKGDVHIEAPPRGSLTADLATVDVEDSRITRATVTGKPAQFTQKTLDGGLTQGHANQITYDLSGGTVQLSDDAWLSDGRNQLSGPLVTYDLLKDRIEASSPGSGQRVHLTLSPQAPGAGKNAPKSSTPPARDSGSAPPRGKSS